MILSLFEDRSDTQDKTGGGVILYYRHSINCKRKRELEVSNIETLWAEITLPNSKPFLVCTLYRPPDSKSEWIDLFKEEVLIAQTTGLELIIGPQREKMYLRTIFEFKKNKVTLNV